MHLRKKNGHLDQTQQYKEEELLYLLFLKSRDLL